MITRDLHVHLYGCLTPEDLWEIGKERSETKNQLLGWYASEYQKAWGRLPDYDSYWSKDDGLERLRQDYVFDQRGNFARFQASFNLIIALCSIAPDNFSVPERIIRKVSGHGLRYFEARTLIPFRFSDSETRSYLSGLCAMIRKLNEELPMDTRIVFSLSRDNQLALKHYGLIRDFLRDQPEESEVISGIDFAFAEEGSPPGSKKDLFRTFHDDNKRSGKLDLLYHVGESFEDKGIVSAIRWVYEAWELGCTRLGHAIALGVAPENYLGKVVFEEVGERLDTLNWLLKNCDLLKAHGYQVPVKDLEKEQSRLKISPQVTRIEYDQAYCEEAAAIQEAAGSILKERNCIIESCPTSNLRIGQVQKQEFHPLRFFHRAGLDYVVATDDPGIFASDWQAEYDLARKITALC